MLSIVLTLTGLIILATGKAPAIFSSSGNALAGNTARVIGFVLALALPISFALGRALPLLLGDSILMFATAVEIAAFALAVGVAFAVGRAATPQTTRR